MNRKVREAAQAWLRDGRPAVVVSVIEAKGSVPRPPGTCMLVGDVVDGGQSVGQCIGTIGGGHLELQAVAEANALLATGGETRQIHYPLGPALGQCCGGAVTLAFERLDAQRLARWPLPEPLFHLQMYGAGHVGAAIARLLATLDCRVDWIDEREALFPALPHHAAAEHIRVTAVDAVEGEVAQAPPGAFYLVLTHSHELDLRITEAILRRGDFGFLGLIGSRTKRQRFVHRFEARGIPSERIKRITCPIGIEGIRGKEPELIAVAVVAQLLQSRAESR
jgi:xanthine dehydrogenase accessory factor